MSESQTPVTDTSERQQLTQTLNRAKLVTLVLEFASTLQFFPKLRQELDAFLITEQTVDYIELANNIRPKLEHAAEFLYEIEHLPTDIADDKDIKLFISHAKANLLLHNIVPLQAQLMTVSHSIRVKLNKKQSQYQRLVHYAPSLFIAGLIASSIGTGIYYWPILQKKLNGYKDTLEPEMSSILAGNYTMGCLEARDKGENMTHCNAIEMPAHDVTVAAFKLAHYEVTFAQWDMCENDNACPHADDENTGRNNHPVVNISWNDTQTYLQWLNKKTGKQYRLPTEAEWEYAARAGGSQAYPWGMSIDSSHANFGNNPGATPVGQYPANDFDLYDMHGNVWEWCQDDWQDNYAVSPIPKATPADHVLRGGSWIDEPSDSRSAARIQYGAEHRDNYSGFRLAISE